MTTNADKARVVSLTKEMSTPPISVSGGGGSSSCSMIWERMLVCSLIQAGGGVGSVAVVVVVVRFISYTNSSVLPVAANLEFNKSSPICCRLVARLGVFFLGLVVVDGVLGRAVVVLDLRLLLLMPKSCNHRSLEM